MAVHRHVGPPVRGQVGRVRVRDPPAPPVGRDPQEVVAGVGDVPQVARVQLPRGQGAVEQAVGRLRPGGIPEQVSCFQTAKVAFSDTKEVFLYVLNLGPPIFNQ